MLLKPASKGFSIVVEFLLQNGADPDMADEVNCFSIRHNAYVILSNCDKYRLPSYMLITFSLFANRRDTPL